MLFIVEGDFLCVASCDGVTVVCCPGGLPPDAVLATARLLMDDDELELLAKRLSPGDDEA